MATAASGATGADPMDTPLMRQYALLKAQDPEAFLFFRLGDFYELFGPDAVRGSGLLGITLTSRDGTVPMAGVPVRAARAHVRTLVRAGYRVAIAEQMEEPGPGKRLVRRAVVEVVTPGAELCDALDADPKARRLAALVAGGVEESGEVRYGLVVADVSTGTVLLGTADPRTLPGLLGRLDLAEVVLSEATLAALPATVRALASAGSTAPVWTQLPALAEASGAEMAGAPAAGRLGPDHPVERALGDADPVTGAAVALLVVYLDRVAPGATEALRTVTPLTPDRLLEVDAFTRRSLEILHPLDGLGATATATLVGVVDHTQTAPGARLLREWLLAPLADRAAIEARQDVVAALRAQGAARARLRRALDGMRDLERLAVRLDMERITPRELGALGESVRRLPELHAGLADLEAAASEAAASEVAGPAGAGPLPLVPAFRCATQELETLGAEVARILVERPPVTLGESPAVQPGVCADLDGARAARAEAERLLQEHAAQERARTGLTSLKLGQVRGQGYHLELSRAQSARVPAEYRSRGTFSNAVRYTTDQLRAQERALEAALRDETRYEARAFDALRDRLRHRAPRVGAAGRALAALDVLVGFAQVAEQGDYVRPRLSEGPVFRADGLRHPVVERLAAPGTYIPNAVCLDPAQSLLVVTGPNMGGKSTVLRAVALTVVLAQAGCPVPARDLELGVADRLMSRVGASDALYRGESTFMVEMRETAAILHHATSDSVVILDELGRGTSSADGVVLAQAVTEALAARGCRTLFATHYHELAAVAAQLPTAGVAHMAVAESGDQVVFLHRLDPGPSDRSYGLHVAAMAGVPPEVVARAAALQAAALDGPHQASLDGPHQASLVGEGAAGRQPPPADAGDGGPAARVLRDLRTLSVAQTTPLDALLRLAAWQQALGASSAASAS